jgi:hypothetical protein
MEIECEQPEKRTAGIEGGGRLPDARLFTARLAASTTLLLGGGRNQGAVRDYQPIRTQKVRR